MFLSSLYQLAQFCLLLCFGQTIVTYSQSWLPPFTLAGLDLLLVPARDLLPISLQETNFLLWKSFRVMESGTDCTVCMSPTWAPLFFRESRAGNLVCE
jgi:hypothetical protein